MLAITPQMRILVAVEAVDLRKGIDSLAELCRAKLQADPFSGCLLCSAAGGQPLLRCWSMTGRDSGCDEAPLQRTLPLVAQMREGAEEPARVLLVHQVQVLLAAGNPDIDAARCGAHLETT